MAADRASLPHVRALDGLRGLALCAILLYHSDHLIGGFLSVDMFFALSGFLITSLLLVEWHNTDGVALARFWSRRARRLLPALAFALVGIAVYAVVFAAPSELARIRTDAFATIAYVANWHAIFAHESYFEHFATPSPLRHAWTLAVEEQFYLIWPLAMFGIVAWWKKRTPVAVLVTAVVMAAVSAIVMALVYTQADPNRAYYGTDTRSYAVFAGIAVAAIVAQWGHATSRKSRAILEAAALVSAVIIAVMWDRFEAQSPEMYHGGFLVGSIALAVLLLAAANPIRGPINRVLSFRGFAWLGTISYGVYLWHWPINLVIDPERTGIDGWPLFAVRTAVALGFGLLSYVLVEQPVRRGAITGHQARWVVPAVTVAIVAVIAFSTAGAQAPASTAIKSDPYSISSMKDRRNLLDAAVPRTRPRILLTGDSVGLTLGLGAPALPTSPFAVATATTIGCGISRGVPVGLTFFNTDAVCSRWPTFWQRGLAVYHPAAIALLAGGWDVQDRMVDGKMLPALSNPLRDHVRRRLALGLHIAEQGHARFILLTMPCFSPATSGRAADLHNLSDGRRIAWYNQILRTFAAEHPSSVRVIDLHEIVCPKGKFVDQINGVPQRLDGVHFTVPAAQRIWRSLTPLIMQAIAEPPTK